MSTQSSQQFPAPLFALTGGIASGKSTVARRLAELGAVIVDSDRIARQVAEPGQPALAELRSAFGDGIIAPDGTLDRPALGALVFADDDARARLNGILHPAIRLEAERQVDEARRSGAGVVVQDIPLLAETGRGAEFALVATVEADAEARIERMVRDRGMTRADAESRIAAQASVEERRAIADVVLANDGTLEELSAQVDALFARMARFSENVRAGASEPRNSSPILVDPVKRNWAVDAARLCARIRRACGDAIVDVEHIGSTSVPHFPAKDIVDLQIEVDSLARVPDLRAPLAGVGFIQREDIVTDTPHGDTDPGQWVKSFFQNADPGLLVNLHVRESGGLGLSFARAFRDELRVNPAFRSSYLAEKERLAEAHRADGTIDGYAVAKENWFADVAWPQIQESAGGSGPIS
jgi:dephospho-CoA kinase